MTRENGASVDLDVTLVGLPSPYLRNPGDTAMGSDGSFYGLFGSGGTRSWIPIGSGGASSIIEQTITGPGAQSVNANTSVALVDPQGGAVTLSLPSLASRTPGWRLQIIQIGAGTIAIQGAGADLVFAETSSYIMNALNDVTEWSPQTTGWRLTGRVGAPQAFTAWVSTTGSDAAVGTAAAPLATVAEAFRRASVVSWTTTAVITLLAGSHAFPANISIPGPSGTAGSAIRILGTVTSAAATGTVTASSAGSASTPMIVTSGGSAYPVSGYFGQTLRFTSGALNGQSTGIFDNTATVLTTYKFAAGTPANGDTFAIDVNASTLTGFPLIRSGMGSELAFDSVNITGGFFAEDCFLYGVRANLVGSVFGEQGTCFSAESGPYGWEFSSATPGATSTNIQVTSINGSAIGLRSATIDAQRDNVRMTSVVASGRSRISVGATAQLIGIYAASIGPLSAGTHFIDTVGGYTSVTNGNISNVTGGSAISATNGRTRLEAVVGTGNAAPAVQARSMSSIQVVSPNVGVTIAAGGADVKVGANANVSWATIAGGGNTNITDFATANTEACRVGL